MSCSPCQRIGNEGNPSLFGMPVWIKRDDLLHPHLSGNKFRKLKYPLLSIQKKWNGTGRAPLLATMGGIWSNHLHATAFAASTLGFYSAGLVRGSPGMTSATLDDCRAQGMHIQFVDRETYRVLRNNPHHWQNVLEPDVILPDSSRYWLPEGGSDPGALRGVAELIEEIEKEQGFLPDTILVACGTAATLAGLLAGLKGRSRVVGIAVLKNAGYLRDEVARLLQQAGYPSWDNYDLLLDFHHGGYSKVSPELRQFCHDFYRVTGIPVEPVYTGKVFFALRQLINSGYFQPQETLMAIHTGGMQGARGMSVM